MGEWEKSQQRLQEEKKDRPYKMAKYFEGTVKMEGGSIGSVIGKGGSNLRRVTRAVGHGAYVVAYNSEEAKGSGKRLRDYVREKGRNKSKADSFYISAGTAEAVRRVASMIKNPERPREVVSVSAETIGTIIGRKGAGIRSICQVAGENCYIVHKHDEGGFVVTADTKSAVARGVQKIKEAERNYFQSQRKYLRKRYQHVEDTKSESSNRYDGLNFSSDEEDDEMEKVMSTRNLPKLGFQHVGSIASRKGDNRKRWAIRQRLMENKIDELEGQGRFDEAEKLSIHDIPWEDVDTFQRETSESRSARRIQLSVEKKAPSIEEYEVLKAPNTSLRRQDTLPQGQWANGVSEDVRSNEGVEKLRSVPKPKKKPTPKPYKHTYIGSWADACDDSEDESDVEEVDLS